MTPIALLGGTFNPPHLGHIQPALESAQRLGADKLGLMPCRLPPHKAAPGITQQHRIAMVELACQHNSRLYPELTELSLPEPSYTVNTLRHLRTQHGKRPICFFIGSDSLYNLQSWYEWESLLDYCHLIVMRRDMGAMVMDDTLREWVERHRCHSPSELAETASGHIWLTDSTLCPVSSTQIREAIGSANETALQRAADWLEPAVLDYIKQHGLYA